MASALIAFQQSPTAQGTVTQAIPIPTPSCKLAEFSGEVKSTIFDIQVSWSPLNA
jgi:hypothetical protein